MEGLVAIVSQYSKANETHKRMRTLLWPLLSDAGWSKRPGHTCAFTRDDFVLWVQPHSFGGSSSGSQLTITLNQSTCHEIAHGCRILRHLDQESRKIGASIEGRIVARFPEAIAQTVAHVDLEHWKTGQDIWLRYYAQADLDEWTEFLLPRLGNLISMSRVVLAADDSTERMPFGCSTEI